MKCSDGINQTIFPQFLILSQDLEEAYVLVHNGVASDICPGISLPLSMVSIPTIHVCDVLFPQTNNTTFSMRSHYTQVQMQWLC